ncbi:MAG: hypothetical protein CVV51_09830 [Spirochaetae bacterium HGW-Spirochaetae-7]|jgi:hypothetical protein|nr:MAG: hypothetical protein CVV51_09830 [Spirochaetae bacterium HGW-Spirochaetae-7]
MNVRNKNETKSYAETIHRNGRLWMVAAIIITQGVPLAISLRFGVWPPLGKLVAGLLPTMMVFWPIAIIEVLTYTPMLGSGGTYLGFVTGNLSNLKVPAAISAMQQAGVEPSTKEGEIISTLAVGASSLVTNLVLVCGVLMMSYLIPVLESPVLKPAFANLLPALFGALGVVFISRNWKIAVAPLALMIGLFAVVPSLPVGILIPAGALVSIGAARFMYRKHML